MTKFEGEVQLSSENYVPADEVQTWLRNLLQSHVPLKGVTVDEVRVHIDYSEEQS